MGELKRVRDFVDKYHPDYKGTGADEAEELEEAGEVEGAVAATEDAMAAWRIPAFSAA